MQPSTTRPPLRALSTAAALVLAPAAARAQAVDLNLTTGAEAPDGRAKLSGGAVISARPAPDLQAQVGLTLAAGDQPGSVIWPGASVATNRAWRDVGVNVQADWTADPRASLKLQLAGGVKSQPIAPAALGEAGGVENDRTESRAGLVATLKPLDAVSLNVTASVNSADDQLDGAVPGESASRMLIRTRDGAVDSGLHWAVTPKLALDAGARLATTSVAWRENASAAEQYVAVQPRVAATVTPLPGVQWRVGLEHAVSPLDAAKFVTLARADDTLAGPDRLTPDQEWRLQGEWTQALPDAGKLRVALTQARVESATELVRLPGDVEGPGSVRGGDRRQLDLALSLPLKPLGLRSLARETSGVWRTSQVQDPLTGAMRRASGEAPYETRVAIAQTLPLKGLKWGLDTRSVGAQSYYGLQQVSEADADQTFGAFVEYRPSDLVLRLQLDNLAGGERRWQDVTYTGDRDLGAPSSVVRRTEGGPSVGISLKKSL
jgi:hypothetical protein